MIPSSSLAAILEAVAEARACAAQLTALRAMPPGSLVRLDERSQDMSELGLDMHVATMIHAVAQQLHATAARLAGMGVFFDEAPDDVPPPKSRARRGRAG